MNQVKQTTDATFEADVLKATTPVLVDFWAPWCGPCKMIAPLLDQIAPEYESRVVIVKVNVDENSETPAKYNVRGIPTLLLFKEGNIIATKVGALTKAQLADFLDSHL